MHIIHPLKPIFDAKSQVLILGSMPSQKSREQNFYYAHPQNRFWQILAEIFHVKLSTNEEKTIFLLNNKIALWDVFSEVDIKGSSDASIKKAKLNDIDYIVKNSNIKAIFCTGKTAFNSLIKLSKITIPINYLPSPSSANAAFSFEQLVKEYQIILEYLKNED